MILDRQAQPPPEYYIDTRGGKGHKEVYNNQAGDKGPPIGGPEDHIPLNGPESWLFGRISSSAVGDVFRFQQQSRYNYIATLDY
jgi:hypothetical protein